MPSPTSTYQHFYYLDRNRLLLPRVALLLFVALGLFLTFYYLADNNFHPSIRHTRVRGKGAFFVLIILLILAAPAWLRVPLSLISLGEMFVFNVALIVWSFDRRPDFAIGPDGIYGIDYLTYRHLSWQTIDRLDVVTWTSKYRTNPQSKLTFVAKGTTPNAFLAFLGFGSKGISVYPCYGLTDDEVLRLAQHFHHALRINRVAAGL